VNPFSIKRTVVEGFESVQINTGMMELSIIPELGGKVNSLRDNRSGREWLWRHPRFEYKQVPYGSTYVQGADTGGWDECFPSVAECKYPSAPWQDAFIQDHGELWSQVPSFELIEEAQRVLLSTVWQGIALPYTFKRTITLFENSGVVHMDYEVTNKSDHPINYVWSIHPLLAIEPGMELHLPESARFNVGGAFPEDLVSLEKKLQYPFAASGLNFPSLPATNSGRAIKLWSDPLLEGEGWATMRASNGELQMRWDVSLLPQVAVWMNLGAFGMDGGSPYYNLGLEPCIGAQDSLNEAVTRYDLFETLPLHGLNNWWLEIELTT
jgi:galactose mutarotase-like enzyme